MTVTAERPAAPPAAAGRARADGTVCRASNAPPLDARGVIPLGRSRSSLRMGVSNFWTGRSGRAAAENAALLGHEAAADRPRRKPSDAGYAVRQQAPMTLRRRHEPEPDVLSRPALGMDYEDHHPTPPEVRLLVEVSDSTLAKDRGKKAEDYARAGYRRLLDRQPGRPPARGLPRPCGCSRAGMATNSAGFPAWRHRRSPVRAEQPGRRDRLLPRKAGKSSSLTLMPTADFSPSK